MSPLIPNIVCLLFSDPEGSPIIHYAEDRVIAQYGRRGFFPFFEDQSGELNLRLQPRSLGFN